MPARPRRFLFWACATGLIVAMLGSGCDVAATVKVYNDSDVPINVVVNDSETAIPIWPGGHILVGPDLNEKLKLVQIETTSEPKESVSVAFDTYSSNVVVRVSGPPLAVKANHGGRIIPTESAVP